MTEGQSSVWGLDVASYTRHALHAESCAWVEKNCYVDLWIELLHAAKLDPMAMLPFTLASDFDGEQWTFYKPPHADLRSLYGVDVQEMNVFKPLLEHATFHASRGRLVLTEADAYWLPDTRGTDYRTQHTKTTIAIESIDVPNRRLGYFHNAGYYELNGEDFTHLLRVDAPPDPTFMPLFAELASFDRLKRSSPADLAARSRALLREWLSERPRTNPVERFGEHLQQQLDALRARGLAFYHAFAFATIRQCGSAYELAGAYLRWLDQHMGGVYGGAAQGIEAISTGMKALILKGARAVNSQKPVDFAPMFREMSASWDAAMSSLDAI
jgi:Domain of unknown function (DUF1839)